ncbi:MAG: ABC transporter ATP-binding protein [Papillibacter sp.]|jgi:ABC-2 type transport system ATP-binding protein|nr:ABC transporter ATP-binding protein [Papillibacter sp.]
MLKIRDFSKTYAKGKKAVDNLNLTINAGEIYGFIGHNGAGKTTTLKAVAGILDFEEGDIFINDISIKDDPVACKQLMAYIPDDPRLYDNLTGIQYLRFIADIYGVDEQLRMKRLNDYGDAFEMTKHLGDLISSYSHGMKQKLSLISAFIHAPKLMILDEPFVGLDPKAAFTLRGFMKELCQNGGAIFFSTHVLDTAEKLCDKVAIIRGGKLVAEGTMDEVKGNESLEQVFLELIENA